MLCPNCLSVMKCRTAINPVPGQPGRDRMDLHCSLEKDGKFGCGARCHMGVITEDPKEWICHEYNFSFDIKYDERKVKTFYLSGHDYVVDPLHQSRPLMSRKTTLYSFFNAELISVDFIPISTGDCMHEEARKLFHRLMDLILFA